MSNRYSLGLLTLSLLLIGSEAVLRTDNSKLGSNDGPLGKLTGQTLDLGKVLMGGSAVSDLQDGTKNIAELGKNFLEPGLESTKSLLKNGMQGAMDIGKKFLNGALLNGGASELTDGTKTAVKSGLSALEPGLDKTRSFIENGMENAFQIGQNLIGKTLSNGIGLGMNDGVKDLGKAVIEPGLNTAKSFIEDGMGKAVGFGKSLLDGSLLKDTKSTLKEGVDNSMSLGESVLIEPVVEGAKTVLKTGVDAAAGVGKSVMLTPGLKGSDSPLANLGNSLLIQPIMQGAKSFIKAGVGSTVDLGKSMFIDPVLNNAKSAMKKGVDNAADMISDPSKIASGSSNIQDGIQKAFDIGKSFLGNSGLDNSGSMLADSFKNAMNFGQSIFGNSLGQGKDLINTDALTDPTKSGAVLSEGMKSAFNLGNTFMKPLVKNMQGVADLSNLGNIGGNLGKLASMADAGSALRDGFQNAVGVGGSMAEKAMKFGMKALKKSTELGLNAAGDGAKQAGTSGV